jgi:predicted Zn-dependent protease
MEFGFLTDSMKFRSFFILIILLLLLIVGYRSYTSTNLNGPPNSGSDKDDTKPSNSPPTVTLESNKTSGEAPFYPKFRYGCNDPEDKIVMCELKSDGKTLFKVDVPPYPDSEDVSWPVFRETGEHTIEITATDKEGLTAYKKITFTVAPSPPRVKLESNVTSGKVPFTPKFRYNCWDQIDDVVSCELKSDGETVFKVDVPPWPEDVSWPVYKDGGEHVLEIIATNSKGLSSSTNLTFNVDNVLNVHAEQFPSDVDSSLINSLRDAFAYWEKIHDISFQEVDKYDEADIYVDWAKEYQTEFVGRGEISGKRMIVGLGDSFCYEKYREFKQSYVANIAIHELGHILGYVHTNDPEDIMHPIIHNKQYLIDVEETVIVPERWFWPFWVCSARNVSTYRYEVVSDEPVNVYFVPSSEDYHKLVDGEKFNFYQGCVSKNTFSTTSECTIDTRNARLVVDNSISSTEARVSVKLIEQ